MQLLPARVLTVFILTALVGACAFPFSISGRHDTAHRIAAQGDMRHVVVHAPPFRLATWHRFAEPGKSLVVYIEGDGRAWATRNRKSLDPTPLNPVALRLAVEDSAPNVLYVARPCQYVSPREDPLCLDSDWWTGKRFAREVVESMAAVPDSLAPGMFEELHLVGFSGGGAVALLIAVQREDVASVRTVAGNLDPDAVNRFHGVSPMPGSLNPVAYARKLSGMPQVHFVSRSDRTVPSWIASRWQERAGANNPCVQVETLGTRSHLEGWENHRARIYRVPACSP